jgi:exopolyphosphatase/guanosine-5'-triphosphate,3'-diphosphate pyrophosphatase
LEELVRNEAEPVIRQARDLGYDFAIGTSGTILALGGLVHLRKGGKPLESPNNFSLRLADLEDLNRALADLGPAERAKVQGLDPQRVDTIHLGGIVLEELLKHAELDEIVLCNRALREGLILDYLERHFDRVSRRNRVADLRERSVLELLSRSGADERIRRHHRHVARLAVALFDQLRPVHELGLVERRLLELAALVHDVGGQIAFERHERHSYYLIKNADLRGFTPAEVDIIALVARYHRGPSPKKRHREYGALRKRDRRVVKHLAALLRIADGLDRSHFQTVRGLKVTADKERVRIDVEAAEDAELEIFTAERKARLFERTFGRALEISHLSPRKKVTMRGSDGDLDAEA